MWHGGRPSVAAIKTASNQAGSTDIIDIRKHRELMTTTTGGNSVAQSTMAMHSTAQVFRKHPEVWITIVLWVASNAFVTAFSKVATWEGGATYCSMADFCRWDCVWFGSVLQSGYDRTPHREGGDAANWPFHPVFPLTAYPLHYWLKLPVGVKSCTCQ